MRLFLRIFFVIPIGFMAAVIASMALYLATFGFRPADLLPPPEGGLAPAFLPAWVLLSEMLRYAMAPFLAGIIAAEWLGLRSMLLWTLFGGAIGLALHLFGFPGNYHVAPALAAGFVGGFVYWLIAGRGAGSTEPIISRERQ
jgi:hypothetical protein